MKREAEWTEPYSQRALIQLDADDRERAHHAGQHAARAREDEAPQYLAGDGEEPQAEHAHRNCRREYRDSEPARAVNVLGVPHQWSTYPTAASRAD